MTPCIMGIEKSTKLRIESNLTYHAVGQGLFSTGNLKFAKLNEKVNYKEIKEFNYVYDCGAVNKSKIEKKIEDYKSNIKIKQLDMLVVSHFDSDHVNGYKQLLENLPVKRIVLPYLEPELRMMMAVRSKYKRDGMPINFILNPTKYLAKFADEIIYVKKNSINSSSAQIIKTNITDDIAECYGVEIDKSTLSDSEVISSE